MRLKLSATIIVIIALQSGILCSQTLNDTISIKEIIVRSRTLSGNYGFKQTTIDSVILNDYGYGNLSDVLVDNSPIYIKSYGLGGLATPSFRGTGANHTQVLWNGTIINSPMLGQSDLSLIPAGLIDEVRIFYGGSSLGINSGGIGGVVNVDSRPSWDNDSQLSINPGIGSFGRVTGLVKYIVGSQSFQSVTRGFLNSAKNDFEYVNSYFTGQPFIERRKNAQVFQAGVMQDFYFRKDKQSTSAHFWYQTSRRNLPAPMTVQQLNQTEKQFDEFFRSILQHKIYYAKNTVDFSLSWFADKLQYINKVSSIDSENFSHTISVKSGLEIKPDNGTTIKVSLSEDLSIINSNNYDSNKERNLIAASTSLEHVFARRAGVVFQLRQSFLDNKLLLPDFSLGVDYRLLDNHEYFIKGNISRNSRIPTMNDMYWIPGGNNILKNEYSYSYELTMEMNEIIRPIIEIKAEATFYQHHIHDMIQWQPGEFRYWTPINIGNVQSSGIEANIDLSYSFRSFSLKSSSGYAFTKTENSGWSDFNDPFKGKQLIYVPKNQINTGIKLFYRGFYSFWIFNYTGKRFITTDNFEYLPGYSDNDLRIGLKININKNDFDFNIRIDNIMGIDYQTIAYQPMPGRSVYLSILYKLIN